MKRNDMNNTQDNTPQTGMKSTHDTTSQTGMKNDTQHNLTEVHNIIIVDESGSMCGLEAATTSGINSTLETIRLAQKKYSGTQRHFVTLVTFDSPGAKGQSMRTIIDDCHIDKVRNYYNYSPYGGTPLYDAVGTTLSRIHNKIKNNPNATGIVTIITDGYENSSTEWDAKALKTLIEQLKDEGWTFSYMGSDHNIDEVTMVLSIENAIEFSHDECGTANTWAREESAKMAYYDKLNSSDYTSMTHEQRREARKSMNRNYYSQRVTPDRINNLKPNEIFVFGTDTHGKHSNWSARYAVSHFGAQPGVAEGLQGQSYALPIASHDIRLTELSIKRFVAFAQAHPHLQFYVPMVGCGAAGLTPETIAPLFKECILLENVMMPQAFWNTLGLKISV
ncbi:MAG: hypothetical protein MJZ74_04980 [Muribaculaceae bacterium]|nr:hypothetical protein [Muribaculaceae bacterium]